MARLTSDTWTCVICHRSTDNGVICYNCEREEIEKQKLLPGALTQKQLNYINHLVSGFDDDILDQIIGDRLPDWPGDYDLLNMNQAGALISALLEHIAEHPPVCKECKQNPPAIFGYCSECYDKVFYNGVRYVQCSAIKKDGEQCRRKGHFASGLCFTHEESTNNE